MAPDPTAPSIAEAGSDKPAALCRLLGIDRAVLGAPMAGVAGGGLAASVTSSGGLGFIGGGYGRPDWLAAEVEQAAGARFGIGLITWNVGVTEVRGALAHGPAAFWLSFDDPRPLAPLVHDAGIPLICQVATVAEAEQAVEAGAAVIVAQGNESGGHGRSDRALFGLLPATVAAVDPIPVVAAGGIVDRSGYDAALALGASGVCLGTRLYATEEAKDAEGAKQRLVDASGDDTVRSIVYDVARGPEWPAGFTGRSLRTPFLDRWLGREREMRARIDDVQRTHAKAAADADFDVRVVWAGEGIDGIHGVQPAADVVTQFPIATTGGVR